jgi:cytochrome c oxidase assembly protein subunit 15
MTDTLPPRWLHRWSLLTLCATLVLLGLGSAVTNLKAGMADPVWPTKPTALLDSAPEQLRDVRWVVEHSHRLAGYVVGCCAIVLAGWLWLRERRRWLCALGTAALLGVCLQGLFGGLRVTEHARWGLEFRIVHGSFAPVVLGLLTAVAVFTSPAWLAGSAAAPADVARLRRGSLLVLGAVYAQVVLGVLLRHTYHPLAQRAHLLVAFAAAVGVAWLARSAWSAAGRDRPLRVAAVALACVLGLQVALGVEAWMTQLSHFTVPEMLPVTAQRVAVRTAHVLGGALLLAVTLCVALLARREAVSAARASVTGTGLEEAA